MLILKTGNDLPISVRNVGHSIGEALKRLEMTFFTELHVKESATKKFEDHIYEMTSIGKNILRLGDEEEFRLDKLYARLAYFQQDYSKHAADLLVDLQKTKQDLDAILAMLVNETQRNFVDEIQMSTVNRLNEIQTLLETNAISTVAGLLRLDWSAVAFIKRFDNLYENAHEKIITALNTDVIDSLKEDPDQDFEKLFAKHVKVAEERLIEYTNTTIAEFVAEEMRSTYDKLFVPSEDLELLKARAIEVASNCMTRGNAKKVVLAGLHKKLEPVKESLVLLIKSIKKKMTEKDLHLVLDTIFEQVARITETNDEDDLIEGVAVFKSGNYRDFAVDLNGTEVEIEIDRRTNLVNVRSAEFVLRDAFISPDCVELSQEEFEKLREDMHEVFRAEVDRVVEALKGFLK